MHYVIIGAGAVGGTIGGQLHRHGHQTTLVARGAQLTALRDRGLHLATPDGDWRLEVPVVGDPAAVALDPECTLVLAVKSQDTQAALAQWADLPVRGGGTAAEKLPLVCAQNGVANERAALRLFARVYGVCVWLPATHLEPGSVVAHAAPHPGLLHLGRYPNGADEVARQISADLSSSEFLAPVREDVMRWKYGKLLGNLSNAITALFGAYDPQLGTRARTEGTAVLAAAGIAHTTPEEEATERGDRIRVRPVGSDQTGTPPGQQPVHPLGSTWQSLARRTGTAEVDYLNGEIVLLGRECRVPTPVNLALQRAVRQAVRTGAAPGEFTVDRLHQLLEM